MSGSLTFLSHARSGLSQLTQAPTGLTGAVRGELKVKLAVGGSASETVTVSPYGPGDVTGIEERQIIRREPRADTDNFAPNLFPFVEFDRPDFPWLFTPLAPAQGKLSPWLVLVIVREGEGNALVTDPLAHPLPKLTVKVTQDDLPKLSESWAWAHVQVTGPLSGSLDELDRTNPERTLSRLLCPRRLRPQTRYLACLVPAFRAGAQAGLGKPVTPGLDPAWSLGTGSIELPVYSSWRFGTGPEGDFESLARRLRPRKAQGVGERAMDASNPGSGLPSAGTSLGLQGALKAAGATLAATIPSGFGTALEKLLDADRPNAGAGTNRYVMPPPLYGRWPVAASSAASAPSWLRELNLDPRHRAAAAIGAGVVRERQEQLMAAAWAQVGEIRRANELLRHAQVSRAATRSAVERRLKPMDDGAFLALVAPMLGRVLASGPATLLKQVRDSALPARALSPEFRRALRPAGPLARRAGGSGASAPGGLLARLNATPSPLAPARELPDGAQAHPDLAAMEVGLAGPPAGGFYVRDALGEQAGDTQLFAQAVSQLQPALTQLAARTDPKPAKLDIAAVRTTVERAIDAEVTLPRRARARLSGAAGVDPGWDAQGRDQLEPVMAAPSFPAHMFGPLREMSQDHVVPGLNAIPPDTATVLETNNRFINSYMLGLNHEMARELLWRGFPTDQRGTYFRQFWDPGTRVPPAGEAQPPDLRDLPALHQWPSSRPLSQGQSPAAAAGKVVLVLRGELLRRYPNTTVYATKAKSATELDVETRYPDFGGTLDPDVAFLGFNLSVSDATGSPGWFFVFQEQPTEPAFGLEFETPGKFAAAQTKLSDISWGELVTSENDLKALTHAPAQAPAAWPAAATGDPSWGASASDLASLTLQEPARVAIHAKHMVL